MLNFTLIIVRMSSCPLLYAVGLDYGDGSVVGSGSGIELPEAEPGLAQLNLTRIITAGSSMSSFGVAILDDDIYEGLESFHINLTISEYFQSMNILEGNPIVSRVDIEDEDSECQVVRMGMCCLLY